MRLGKKIAALACMGIMLMGAASNSVSVYAAETISAESVQAAIDEMNARLAGAASALQTAQEVYTLDPSEANKAALDEAAAAYQTVCNEVLEENNKLYQQMTGTQAEQEPKETVTAGTASSETVSKPAWDGTKLTKKRGALYGPTEKEVYYNMNMSKVVQKLKKAGYSGDYWVRDDGVRMFGDYVMCAAAYSLHPYGSLVETSLGTAIVCDTGSFIYSNPHILDIATTW